MPTLQYTDNGDGQRVQTVESGVTKKQVWDKENILLEIDGAGVRQCDNACDTAYPVTPGVGGGLQNRLCKEMCRAGYDLFQSGFNSSFCDGLKQRCAVIAADPCDKRKDLKYGICITLVEALCEGNAGGGPD